MRWLTPQSTACRAACWDLGFSLGVLTLLQLLPSLLARWPLGADCSLRTAAAAEYAEQKLFAPLGLDAPQDRPSKWQQLGRRHPGLEACILAANPSWQADLIPAK